MANKNKDQNLVKRLFTNLRYKYKFVMMNESTMEERLTFRLSRLNVIIVFVLISLFSVTFTIFIISVTPLKEYIPGYASVERVKQVYINDQRIDSLSKALDARDLYLKNIKETILQGKPPKEKDTLLLKKNKNIDYKNIKMSHSEEDSMLREEWDDKEKYDLIYYPDKQAQKGISSFMFFSPVEGQVVGGFNLKKKHYGVDLTAEKDEPVKATLDGMVLLATWTVETGYVVVIQHESNLISVYKHNSVLLKKEGDFVKAGDPVAISGNSGELTSGKHLHFELWYNGNPVNPSDFLIFD